MKKKAHLENKYNYISIKSDNPFVNDVSIHIIGNKVFIETEDQSICLSDNQAKTLSYFINDRLVRVVDLGIEGDEYD